jgi:UDP-N-acetyl-D-glucosamine dehydrogenase
MHEEAQALARDRTDGLLAEPVSSIVHRFHAHQAAIGILGLGYVGLPLACTIARKGFSVLGFDIDLAKVDQINAGVSYIGHISSDEIAEMRKAGRFAATSDYARLKEVDAIILCVPTPLTRHREPDLTYVVQTTEAIAPHLKPGQLIVLESTTYPGTTRDVLRPILERNGAGRPRQCPVLHGGDSQGGGRRRPGRSAPSLRLL